MTKLTEEYLDYLADNAAMLDEMEREGQTEPQPAAPHVALAACVSGQHISQGDYDALTEQSNQFRMTVAQYIRQIVADHALWLREFGEEASHEEA